MEKESRHNQIFESVDIFVFRITSPSGIDQSLKDTLNQFQVLNRNMIIVLKYSCVFD